MIRYERLETGTPKDVKVVTDDADLEMSGFKEMIAECGFEIELPGEPERDGNFVFTIPGMMVGEFADCTYEIDDGLLEKEIERWNHKTVSDLDDDA
jgi:hypothetical protein